MHLTPLLLGLLAGAVLGVLITDLDRKELSEEASFAFRWSRIRQLWVPQRRNQKYKGFNRFVWGLTRIQRLEWIAFLLVSLLLFFLLWIICSLQRYPSIDTDWLKSIFIGSVIGAVSAPWVWLHFSKELPAETLPNAEDAGAVKAGLMSRYQFLTIALGILLLLVALGPFLMEYLSHSTKLEAFGVSISQPERSAPNQGTVFASGGTSSPGNRATDKLTKNTKSAMRIANRNPDRASELQASGMINDLLNRVVQSPPVQTVIQSAPVQAVIGSGPQGADTDTAFEALPTLERDKAYIAYFVHAAQSDARSDKQKLKYDKIRKYIDDAVDYEKSDPELKKYIDSVDKDEQFIEQSKLLFECLQNYAVELGDIHLFFLETSDFLKYSALLLAQSEQDIPEPVYFPHRAKKEDDDTPKAATPTLASALPDFQISVNQLWGKMKLAKYVKSDPKNNSECTKVDAPKLEQPPLGATPYPALLALYSLTAVDSPETGIWYLSHWIGKVENKYRKRQPPAPRLQWYLMRASINLSQIIGSYLKTLFEPARLITFQREMTDKFRTLLQVRSVKEWKDLCNRLKGNDIHSQIGRNLAFHYASERNFLFELEEPGLIRAWRQGRRNRLTDPLQGDLDEAAAIAGSPHCFRGVSQFESDRLQWQGQFQLNVAQLKLALLSEVSESDRKVELRNIKNLLDLAQQQLGVSFLGPPDQPPTERLLGSDAFDDQRRRVESLQLLVARLGIAP